MFDIYSFIDEKRLGKNHKNGDMRGFVAGYQSGKFADSQVSAWLMAVCLNGLSDENLLEFTQALSESGKIVLFPFEAADKHSTGGIGDKLTLLIVPIAASMGVKVAKLSGRALGFTGGTVDKLEAIPGFNISLGAEDFVAQVEKIGCAISGHSVDLAPAEAKFYSLRDTTATLESVPLIASSIVSKKIAGGAKSILYDVKCGAGAFMKNIDEARTLAGALVSLSKAMGRKAIAFITDMNQPLGASIGNSLEVIEAIETLKGSGPSDVFELAAHFAGAMLHLSSGKYSLEDGIKLAKESVKNGSALKKLRELVIEQGGVGEVCDDPRKYLRVAPLDGVIKCRQEGYLASINKNIGEGVKKLGGGREQKGDTIDVEVGVRVLKKVGDKVSNGEPLLEIYSNDKNKTLAARPYLEDAFVIGDGPFTVNRMILEGVK